MKNEKQSRLPHSCKLLMKKKDWYKIKIEIISEHFFMNTTLHVCRCNKQARVREA